MIKFKRIFYILIVISILSIIIAIVMFMFGRKQKIRRKKAEKKLANIIQEKKVIQSKLKKAKAVKEELQKNLKKAQARTGKLSKELRSVKGEMGKLKEKLTNKTKIAKKLRRQLKKEKDKSESLSKKLKQLHLRKQELESRFETLKDRKKNLKSELKETDKKMRVQLDKIVVSSKDEELPYRILVVNRKYDFIIANLGEDEVLKDSKLGIYRDGKLIANAKVGNIYPNMCSAEITNRKKPIKEGDKVKVSE